MWGCRCGGCCGSPTYGPIGDVGMSGFYSAPPGPDHCDIRYLRLAEHVATWSKDPSTKVGAVIVRPDKSLCSVGFNGFPKKMPDTEELYLNRDEKYSRIVHAEVNAKEFAREPVDGYTMYTSFMPCDRCFVQMVQAGIARFVFPKPTEEQLTRWGPAFEKVRKYAAECGVGLLEVDLTQHE